MKFLSIFLVLAGTMEGALATVLFPVGVLGPSTGPLAAFGPRVARGPQLFFREAGSHNTLCKPRLKFKFKVFNADTQSKAQPAINSANQLISFRNVLGIIGPLSSSAVLAVAEMTIPKKVVLITPTATSPKISTLPLSPNAKRSVFRTVASDVYQGKALATFVHSKKISTVSVLYENTAYGEGLKEAFVPAFRALGGHVDGIKSYTPGAGLSYKAELLSLSQGKVLGPHQSRYLVLFAFPRDGKLIVRESLSDRVYSDFLTTDGLALNVLGGHILDEHLMGIQTQGGGARSALFKSLFHKAFKNEIPHPYATNAFDATRVLASAIVAASYAHGLKKPSREQVQQAVLDVTRPQKDAVPILPGEFHKAVCALDQGKPIHLLGASGNLLFDSHGDITPNMKTGFKSWVLRNGVVDNS